MGHLDDSLPEVSLTVPTGVEREIPSTWVDEDGVALALGAVSLWIGGDDDDLDDTTGATEVVGVVASNVATFTIPATTTVSQLLRLEQDGAMVGVGKLRTSKKGRRTTSSFTVQVGTSSATFQNFGGLPAHLADTTDAHDASAISVADAGGLLAATNVETALAELATDADAHLADTVDAHDASAISLADLLGYYTAEEVETALAEAGAILDGLFTLPRSVPLFIRPQDFILGQAGPVLELISGRWSGWTLRDGNLDRVNTTFTMPHVNRVDIDLLWLVKASAATGDVVFTLHLGEHNVGDTGSTITTLGDANGEVVITAASGSEVLKRHRLAGNVDIETDFLSLLMVTRTGNDVLDTLAASVSLLGLIITPTPTENVLTHDGVWCWFNESRLIADEATDTVYGGLVTQQGSVGIAALDVTAGTATEFTLATKLEVDDHDAPGIVIRPDGRILAAYSRHSVTADPIHVRISTNAGDISAWGADAPIDLAGLADDQPCYPKPFYLGANLFLMFRNGLEQWIVSSTDNGATWGTPFKLFAYGGSGNRGYVNLRPTADGTRVDIITTDAHPTDASDVDLWHCWIDDDVSGTIRATDGTAISSLIALAFSGAGLAPSALTQVYEASTDGDSWGWDLTVDGSGNPVVAFATFPSDTAHSYHVAHWNGSAWVDTTLLDDAGGTFCDRGSQPHYSGGIALASELSAYVSRDVAGQWEIERWDRASLAAAWRRAELVTRRSAYKQVRPTVPEHHYDGCPPVFWCSGWYTHYVRYGTRLVYADP